MDDIVVMTITECTTYLPRKLSGCAFPEASMTDNVVEHLAAVDVLENHVIMVLMNDHLAHAADVGMVEEHRKGRFAQGADLLGGILGGLFGGVGGEVCGGCRNVCTWQNLDSKLTKNDEDKRARRNGVTKTFSPVTL